MDTGEIILAVFCVLVGLAFASEMRQRLMALRAVPLPQRNLSRATYGAFVLVFVIVLARSVRLYPPYDEAALVIGALAVLYLVVGICNSRGAAFDVMSAVWWTAGAAICGWLLLSDAIPLGAAPFWHAGLVAGCIAAGVACVLRVILMMRPVSGGAKLPPPSTVPGMPISGPASPAAVHAALGGRRRRGFLHWILRT
jgi:hypothetical protein